MLPLILAYHKIERRHELGVTRISPERFRRQIERFARDGWRSLTLDELASCVDGSRAAGPREFVITFDDAYRGLREHAFPVLRDHGFTAVCSVITEFAGRLNRWDVAYGGRRFAHLSWRDIRAWRARGIEFISHTATHRRLTWLADDEAADEMHRSRATMAAELGDAPRWLSYPYGVHGARERGLARAAGYENALTLVGGWRGDRMAVPRHPVYLWAPPKPGVGPLAAVERIVASATNRCAVGTSVWQALHGRRYGDTRRVAAVQT